MFKGGYKYILKISSTPPIGIQLSIKVVPGEFDDSLSWPCKEKVRVTLMDPQQPLVNNVNSISGVIYFEKGKEPCSRPLHVDHHKYHVILGGLTKRNFIPCIQSDTILLRASRE